MSRTSWVVIGTLLLVGAGGWVSFRQVEHQSPSRVVNPSTFPSLSGRASARSHYPGAGVRPRTAEAADHVFERTESASSATTMNDDEISRLSISYRTEKDTDRKLAIGRRLAERGDASVVELFSDELFADYGGKAFPKQEGFRMCGIPGLLALLGRRVPKARQVLIQGLDPEFWNRRITWSVAGESPVELLVRGCIASIPFCEDEDAWEALIAFRNEQNVQYLFHFSGSFLDAACIRYWLRHKGRKYLQSRTTEQFLDDIGRWRKTSDGKRWLAWESRVRAQWEASTAQDSAAKP